MTSTPPRLFLTLVAAALMAACGGGDKAATQTAAKVNKEQITVQHIDFVLSRQQGLKPEQADAAARQVLERLIDQELAVQQAEEQKLDRSPQVAQRLEAAKREVLALAYAERLADAAAKPTAQEVSKYYDEHPALFAERRIYSLQEITIEAAPERFAALRASLAGAKNLNEFTDYLKANDFKFTGTQAVRSAEQLPMSVLPTIAKLADGQSVITQVPSGLQVLVLAGSRNEPVDLERAKRVIETYLTQQRRGEVVAKRMKELRAAAKIEYVGKFAEKPATAAAVGDAASAPASAPVDLGGGEAANQKAAK